MILIESIKYSYLNKNYIALEESIFNNNIFNEGISDVVEKIKEFIRNKIKSINIFFKKIKEMIINFVDKKKKIIDQKYKSPNIKSVKRIEKQNKDNSKHIENNEPIIDDIIEEPKEFLNTQKDSKNTNNLPENIDDNKPKEIIVKWSSLRFNRNDIMPKNIDLYINKERDILSGSSVMELTSDIKNIITRKLSSNWSFIDISNYLSNYFKRKRLNEYFNLRDNDIKDDGVNFIFNLFGDPDEEIDLMDEYYSDLIKNIVNFIDGGGRDSYKTILDTITKEIDDKSTDAGKVRGLSNKLLSYDDKNQSKEVSITDDDLYNTMRLAQVQSSFEMLKAFAVLIKDRIISSMNVYEKLVKNKLL